MSWFYVDDRFHANRKVRRMPASIRMSALGLWTVAGSFCRDELTCGEITMNEVISLGGTKKLAEALVAATLWEHTATGYRFHNWQRWQDTPAEVAEKKAANRLRQQRHRDKRKSSRNAVTNALVTPAVTGMSLGEGEGEGTCRSDLESSSGVDILDETERQLAARRPDNATHVLPLVAVRRGGAK